MATTIPSSVSRRLSRRQRLLIATLVCLVSLFAAGQSYSALLAKEEASVLLSGYLVPGTFSYQFLHREGDKEYCIGSYKSTFGLLENSYTYEGKGEVRVKVGGDTLTPSFVTRLEFSELNQLGASTFRMSAGTLFLNIGTVGVDPIGVYIRFADDGPLRTYTFNLPGPIELKKSASNEFGLRYPQLQRAPHLAIAQNAATQLKDQFLIRETAEPCLDDRALDMDPYVNGLQGFLSTINPSL